MPGESPAVFGDALQALWPVRQRTSTRMVLVTGTPPSQPSRKLAEDRAEQLKRNPDKVVQELDSRLRSDLRNTASDFSRVHPLPQSGQDVPDDLDARLVVLGIDTPYSKEKGNLAETAAQAILESRGSAPRIYRNTLVFLAADKTRLQDLDEAVRRYLAWESILGEREQLDLSPHQVKQAEVQKEAASNAGYGQAPGDVPVAPGTGSVPSRRFDGVAGHEAIGPGFARRQGEQEAERAMSCW